MKILHVIDSGGLYGAEMVLLTLAEEQKRLGHDVCIASIGDRDDGEKPIETEARARSIDVAVFRMAKGPNIYGALRIVRFARTNAFHILHSHGYKPDILLGILPRRIRKLPLVCTVHGWTSAGALTRMRFYEWADALCLRRADAVCLVSDAMRSLKQIAAIDRSKVHVIPNGITRLDTSVPPPDDEITRFCSQGFTVVSIGRLSREKGYDILLRAFASLNKNLPHTRLLIIGEGPERERLEALAHELNLDGKIMLPGYRNRAWRYLKACKVFVLSSLTEGLPITLLEAVQTGIPVIATRVGGIPSIISNKQTGILIPPGVQRSLERAMASLVGDGQIISRLALRPIPQLDNIIGSTVMTQKYIEIYKGLSPAA